MNRVSSRTPLAAALVLTVLSAGVARAQIAWEGDFQAAKQRAAAEKRVLFVAINMDGEKANQEMATKTYADPMIVAWSQQTVNLIASKYDHRSGTKPCPRFGSIPCEAHMKVDIRVREGVVKQSPDGFVVAPQHVFLDPEGKVILSVPYAITAQELQWCFTMALSRVQPDRTIVGKAPKRLVMGDVFDPASETGSGGGGGRGDLAAPSGGPITKEEAKEIIRALKKQGGGGPGGGGGGGGGGARLEALAKLLGCDDPEVVSFVKTEIGARWFVQRSDETKAEIVHRIGAIAEPGYWEVVETFAEAKNETLRTEAAIALEQLGTKESLPVVQAGFARELSPLVKRAWVRALGTTGTHDAGVRRQLASLARGDKDAVLRANALVALGMAEPLTEVTGAFTKAIASKAESDRIASACGMGLSRDARYIAVLEKAIALEASPEPKSAMEKALAVLKGGPFSSLRPIIEAVTADASARERLFGAGS